MAAIITFLRVNWPSPVGQWNLIKKLDVDWYLYFLFNIDDMDIDYDEITKYESLGQCKYNETMHYLDDDFIDIDLKPDDLDWFNEFG